MLFGASVGQKFMVSVQPRILNTLFLSPFIQLPQALLLFFTQFHLIRKFKFLIKVNLTMLYKNNSIYYKKCKVIIASQLRSIPVRTNYFTIIVIM